VRLARALLAMLVTMFLAACAMPQTTTLPQGGGSSSSSQGSQSSSGSSGSQGSQSSSGSSGSEGSEGSSDSEGSEGSSDSEGSEGSSGSSGSQGSAGQEGGSSSSGPSGSSSQSGSAGDGGGMTVGEQLPWPSGEMGSTSGEGLDEEFEDSLDDFDEAVAGGASGGDSEKEIDILNPMGSGNSGAPSDEPLFEEGNPGEEGDSAENQSIAQRAASGGSDGAASAGGGQGEEGGGASSESSGTQPQDQSATSGGGGAAAEQGDKAAGGPSTSGAAQGSDDIIPIPEDIGDGRNDDIVLRQIREAAVNERDPVLREKLWDEYRRIRGTR